MINKEPFTSEVLNGKKILVIANAKGPAGKAKVSPFTIEECNNIRKWVEKGGALLLITDHYPFGGAVENLAYAFNVEFQRKAY